MIYLIIGCVITLAVVIWAICTKFANIEVFEDEHPEWIEYNDLE